MAPTQLQLDFGMSAGLGGVEYAVKEAMNQAARACGLTRGEIVERMEKLAARHGVKLTAGTATKLTEAVLEKWLNPQDQERSIPLKALPLFCQVTGSPAPLLALAAPLGLRFVDPQESRLLEMAKIQERIKQDRLRLRRMEQGGNL